MNPHGFPPRQSSLSPPRAPPKATHPLLPPIPLDMSMVRPINTKSPVRRKPLPANAFSPTSSVSAYSRGASPEFFDQRIEPLASVAAVVDHDVRDLDR